MLGDEAADQRAVDEGGVRRCEIARDDDVGMVQAVEFLSRFSEQVPEDALGHILDVDDALLQVGVVDRTERAAVFFRDLVENEFDVVQLALQSAQGLVDQRAVLDHQEVRVEDTGIVRTDRPGDFLLDIEKLLTRGDEGGLEAFDLAGDVRLLDVAKGYFLFVLPVDDDLRFGNAGRYAQSLAD